MQLVQPDKKNLHSQQARNWLGNTCLKEQLQMKAKLLNYNRVGHLILRALAIRASNPQNALAQISFDSPKVYTPPLTPS